MNSDSRVVRTTEGGWEDVEPRAYKDELGAYLGVVRHTLLGGLEAPERLGFEVRYFELEPGGYSSLERHRHAHAVVVIRGTGSVRLGDRTEAVRPFDVVYVAPGEVHRFQADRGERLGFLCVVDADRDRPVPVRE